MLRHWRARGTAVARPAALRGTVATAHTLVFNSFVVLRIKDDETLKVEEKKQRNVLSFHVTVFIFSLYKVHISLSLSLVSHLPSKPYSSHCYYRLVMSGAVGNAISSSTACDRSEYTRTSLRSASHISAFCSSPCS